MFYNLFILFWISQIHTSLVIASKGTKLSIDRDFSLVAKNKWTVQDFPMLPTPHGECKSSTQLFCDPDGLLTKNERSDLDTILSSELSGMKRTRHVACQTSQVPVQYAAALVYSMDLSSYLNEDSDKESIASQVLARSIHDSWGVGNECPCGGTGALIFLSDRDRTIYISRGMALERIFTDRRLDTVIRHMKPHLGKGVYGTAFVKAFQVS